MDFTLLKTLVIRWQNQENERFHGRHVVYDMINHTAAFNTSFFLTKSRHVCTKPMGFLRTYLKRQLLICRKTLQGG